MRQIWHSQAILLLLFFGLSACHLRRRAQKSDIGAIKPRTQLQHVLADNDNLLLGFPQVAVSDTSDHEKFLIERSVYSLSYNDRQGKPNWVCWHLSRADLGSTGRSGKFHADSSLPSNFYRVKPSDFTKVGFDRGHNCPSGDRTANVEANNNTFLMSNMVAQAPRSNRQTWAHLEEYIRSLITAGNEAYIMMGNYGLGGVGSVDSTASIAGGRIAVPSHIWKVAVVLPEGDNDLTRMDTTVRVIAVDTPNRQDIATDWRPYLTSIHQIDSAAGVFLLRNVPESVLKVLELKKDKGN